MHIIIPRPYGTCILINKNDTVKINKTNIEDDLSYKTYRCMSQAHRGDQQLKAWMESNQLVVEVYSS